MAYDMTDVFELLGFLVEQQAKLYINTQQMGNGVITTEMMLEHFTADEKNAGLKYVRLDRKMDMHFSHPHRCSKGIALLKFLTDARNEHDLKTSPDEIPEPPKGAK